MNKTALDRYLVFAFRLYLIHFFIKNIEHVSTELLFETKQTIKRN